MKHVFNLVLFFITAFLYSADNNFLEKSFKNLPFDIQWLIGRHLVDEVYKSSIKTYPIDQRGQDSYILLIPTFLRSINLVTTTSSTEFLPDEQCWSTLVKPRHPIQIRLQKDSQKTESLYQVANPSKKIYFDGINNENCAIHARCSTTGTFIIYLLELSIKSRKRIYLSNQALSCCGILQSIILHPECNRIALSKINDKKYFIEILEMSANNRVHHVFGNNTGLYNVSSAVKIAEQQIDTSIQKIVFLGNNQYLALNDYGNLLKFELTKNSEQKNKIIVHAQTHPNTIKDMAVDRTRRTVDDRMPHIAFMTNKGEIFISDLRLFKKPTMVLVHTIKDPDNAALYYHDKKLGLMYSAENDVRKKFEVFSDCYELLYLKALLAMR